MEWILLYVLVGGAAYFFLRGSGEVPAWVKTETVDGKEVQVISTTDEASRAQYGLVMYGKAQDVASTNPTQDAVTGTNMKDFDSSDTSLGGVMAQVVTKYKDPRLVMNIGDLTTLLDAVPVSANGIPGMPDVEKLPSTFTLYILERADAAAKASKGSDFVVLGTAAQKAAT